jgi:radical SAM superfamily enzyme YgiQ (UPF0313 family)
MRPRDRILTTGSRHESVPPNPTESRLRAALINPPDPSSSDNLRLVPPLGLGYVASYARCRGFHVDLFDLALDLEPTDAFMTSIGAYDGYDVYGVSTYSDTFPSALAIAGLLKRAAPDRPVVVGGYHAAVLDREILEDFPEIDFVVRDEGEIPFVELLERLAGGSSDYASIASLTWRDGRGQVIQNPSSERLLDQDELPFPATEMRHGPRGYRDYLDMERGDRRRAVSLVSSRGCPKRCTFCSIALVNPLWRARSADSIMSEVRYRYEAEPFEHVFFQDGNFFASPKRSLEFARQLRAFDPSITWSATATPDHVVRHAKILPELSELGCAYLELGIESGNEGSLARFGKGTTREVNLRAIQLLDAAGIRLGLDFIMFEPEMTVADVRANLEFLNDAELYGYWPAESLFQELRLYPGTKMRDRHVALGLECNRHEVPSTPFYADDLAAVFREAWRYRQEHQAMTDEAVKQVHKTIAGVEAVDAGGVDPELRAVRQDLQERAIRLRHLPYAFLETLAGTPGRPRREPDEARSAAMRELARAVSVVQEARAALGDADVLADLRVKSARVA